MIKLSSEERIKIKNEFLKKLEKSFDVAEDAKGTAFYKALLHLVNVYNSGDFYGTVKIKIAGVELKQVWHDNVSIRVDEEGEEKC